MRSPLGLPNARRGVFTAAEAYARGWTPDDLLLAVRRGDVGRPRRGVYTEPWRGPDPEAAVRREDVELARRAIAAALTSEAVVVGHLAAVELSGWPVWAPRPRSCVTVTDNRSRVPGLHVHRTPIGADALRIAGYGLTRPARTVLDVACEFGTEAGLVVADAALACGALDLDELRHAVEGGTGRTGIAAARPLLALADGRAESPLESRSRWQCVQHGLPRPEPQVCLYDVAGRFLGRVDLFWPDGVVGEVDGAGKLTDPGARKALLERQTGLTRAGLRVVRWGVGDLAAFGRTAAWIREELAAAATDSRPPRWRAVST